MLNIPFIGMIAVAAVLGFLVLWLISLRKVVSPNWVHIVQSAKKTTSYGKGKEAGNVYYNFPEWLPILGLTRMSLPVSVIELQLAEYLAYDKEKVPFRVDVAAFFRIKDTNKAAERVSSYQELLSQLETIMEGAVRTVLAAHEVDKIMVDRSTFGEQFTSEIEGQLEEGWGVEAVKNMELMDIRDADGTSVISDIQAKRSSAIEKESRIEVANNIKDAEIAEIAARRDRDLEDQEAIQRVGERTADQERAVGIAKQKAEQEIKTEQKTTKEREMEVIRVAEVKKAEITKDQNIVKAEEDKQTTILRADGDKEAEFLKAQAIKEVGVAQADAEAKMKEALIAGDLALAKEIGTNDGYQTYLVQIRAVEANEKVGIEQAKALEKADVKVIANTGEAVHGVDKAMQLFTPKGGTSIAGMLEGLANSPIGREVLNKFTGGGSAQPTNEDVDPHDQEHDTPDVFTKGDNL